MSVAVENIWNDFSGKLRQFIRGRVADDSVAADILQEVFVKIQTRLPQLDDSSKLQGWIFLIARNAIIDHYRLRKETVPVPETLVADSLGDDGDIEELNAAFRGMINDLPDPYREAIILTEIEGLTQKQLAERLGISLSGAKSRVQRGREQLKEALFKCCEFQFDTRGRVIDCSPRPGGGCDQCAPR